MTVNEVKKLAEVQMRNNEFELKGEIQRTRDTLDKYEPGSKEYDNVLKHYVSLLEQEKELKRIEAEKTKIVWGAAFTVGGWIMYRALIDKAADPFFREIGKSLLKLIHV